jgi:hypothetical protein
LFHLGKEKVGFSKVDISIQYTGILIIVVMASPQQTDETDEKKFCWHRNPRLQGIRVLETLYHARFIT